jgi:hypothetical protein
MHEKHVTVKTARCFDCHQPIKHTKADFSKPLSEQDGFLREACSACHPEPHRLQQLLATGPKREGVLASPDPMHKARTNCLGCHVEMKYTKKGQRVMMASGQNAQGLED